MKEYTYEVEHSWEKHRRPVAAPDQHHRQRQQHQRHSTGEDAAMDADASSMSETTSESGVSDLETSMTDFRCTCCPYGYHLDTDFMKFLDDMYGPDVLRTLKKIERKRHDIRRRLINEQPGHTIPVQTCSTNNTSLDNEILRETLLELDRIVEKDIKELEAECHRHANNRSSHTHQQRSRSVDSRRHLRPPPRPPTGNLHSTSSRTAEEHRLYERRMQMEKTIKTRTHSAPRLNLLSTDTLSTLRKLDTTGGGPITMLYKIPPPPFSRSSSSSSISTEPTLRVSSPEPDDRQPLKPLYITEITVPPKPVLQPRQPTKTTVVTITDKTEIERRNREIERLEQERRTLLSEKELLLKEIDRYKHRPIPKAPEQQTISIKREVAIQHMVEDDQPPPLPPKQRQQRDVAISHTTEYDDDDEKQAEIVRRKLEEIKNFYTERIHILEDKILEQEKDIDRLTEPKKQRHVNTQCAPTMQDRALVTDVFRSVRDVALTCNLQPPSLPHRDVNLQCNTDDFIQKRDVWIEALPDQPVKRDVAIGVAISLTADKHYRDVATHVNLDAKPEVRQRDVAVMFTPEPILKHDRASNTQAVQTKEFGGFANTIEPPKSPPKPVMRQAATDTRTLYSHRHTASGPDEIKHGRDTSTDTSTLVAHQDRASGNDVPPDFFSRHASTDTRTLVTTRDNFSTTIPVPQTVRNDAWSNTNAPAEQRHTGVQAIQEQPVTKHSTTSIEQEIFHQLGHLRHNVSNTERDSRFFEVQRSTRPAEESVEEVITFRLPEPFTEETYETTVTKNQAKYEDVQTISRKSETIEWTRALGTHHTQTSKQEQKRSTSPEELVEESYEVISTLTKPEQSEFGASSSTRKQQYLDESAGKLASSEDDSSYCEEWTVTEAKRKQDGQTVQTIIDRGGHHRYSMETQGVSTQDINTSAATQTRLQASESLQVNRGTQIREHEETVQLSPSTTRKTTIYEAHRTLATGQPIPPIEEPQIEERYEVTLSSASEQPPLIKTTDQGFELEEEMYIACAIVNESLYDKSADKKKVHNSFQLIQHEWFRISSQREVDGQLVQGYLNSIKEHFSNFLLERIVNLQDANGNTALHYCVTNGHWHVVNMLLETKVCDVCLQNHAGYTAVMMAAVIDLTTDEQKQVVRRLFRESGNVNVKTTTSNQTALMLAVKHGKIELVELLLENGAGVNLQDADGSTALMCAVEHQALNIVKLLLTRPECDVNIADNDGQTAVSIATNNDRKDILVALYAKMKERKGHHSALASSRPRIPTSSASSRVSALDRSTASSSSRRAPTETTSSSSRRTSGTDSGPTVSKFRRS